MVDELQYLGPTISSKLTLDKEIDKLIGRAASDLARRGTRVWKYPRLTIKTKMSVYNNCIQRILLYGSNTWTTYAAQ